MKHANGWMDGRIRDFFASSVPGDWGTDGTPEDGVAVLRSTNFRNNGSIDYTDIAYRQIEEGRLSNRRVDKGTILIEKSGGSPTQAAGRVVYCDRDFGGTASNFIEVVKAKDEFSSHFVAFLLYYLYQIGLVHKYQQQTTGIINFKLGKYSEEIISYPVSKREQTKIAEILSTVDRAIEQTEALIAKQLRIETGLMQDLLTRGIDEQGNLRSEKTHESRESPVGRIPVEWESTTLGELGVWSSGGTPSKSDQRFWGGEIPWVTPKDMKSFDLESTTDRITDAGVRFGSKLMPEGTIFIVIRGMILAHTFPVGYATRPMAFNQDVKAVVAKPGVIARYLAYWLTSHEYEVLKITTTATHGTKRFDMSELYGLDVSLPNASEQRRIIGLLDHQQERIRLAKSHEMKLRSLKTALMQDLLTGEKRVTPLLKADA